MIGNNFQHKHIFASMFHHGTNFILKCFMLFRPLSDFCFLRVFPIRKNVLNYQPAKQRKEKLMNRLVSPNTEFCSFSYLFFFFLHTTSLAILVFLPLICVVRQISVIKGILDLLWNTFFFLFEFIQICITSKLKKLSKSPNWRWTSWVVEIISLHTCHL